MILSLPLLITFTWTKDLASSPVPSATLQWFIVKISTRKTSVLLTKWLKKVYHEFDFKRWWCSFWTQSHVLLLDHQHCCKRMLQTLLLYHHLSLSDTTKYVLHTYLLVNAVVKSITLCCLHKTLCEEVKDCEDGGLSISIMFHN